MKKQLNYELMEKVADDIAFTINDHFAGGCVVNIKGHILNNLGYFKIKKEDYSPEIVSLDKIIKLLSNKNINVIKLNRNKQIVMKKDASIDKILNYMDIEDSILYSNLPNSKISVCIG